MSYPRIYHMACSHQVAFGGHGGDTARGRQLVAGALRCMRTRFGRERTQFERRSMLYISGQFPIKGDKYARKEDHGVRIVSRAPIGTGSILRHAAVRYMNSAGRCNHE